MYKKLLSELFKEGVIKLYEENGAEGSEDVEKKDVPPIKFPSWFINENMWGKNLKTRDRTLITKIGGAISGENTPLGRAEALQNFLINVDEVKKDIPMQQALANLMFLDIFASIVHQFNAAVAGFLFEALFAGIFEGEQIEAKKGGGKYGTIDVMLKTADGTKGYSFKLLGQTGGIKGSFRDLIAGIEEHGAETYLVVLKKGEAGSKLELDFWEFEIRPDNWFDWIGHSMLEETGKGTGAYQEKMQYVIKAAPVNEKGERIGFKPEQINDEFLKQEMVIANKPGCKFCSQPAQAAVHNKTQVWDTAPVANYIVPVEGQENQYTVVPPKGNRTFIFNGEGKQVKGPLVAGQTYYFNAVVKKYPVRIAKFGKAGAGLYRELIDDKYGLKEEFEDAHKTPEYPLGMPFIDYVNTGEYKKDPEDFFKWIKRLQTAAGEAPAVETKEEEPSPEPQHEARNVSRWEKLCESFFKEDANTLTEAKGKETKVTAGQFDIDQNFMIRSGLANQQYGGKPVTLTLDRKLLTVAAKGYTSVISQQVFDIFNSLSELIKDINLFYLSKNVNERNSAGEDAGEQAGELKKNTDEHIVASVKQSSSEEGVALVEETESRRPLNLDKLINEALKDIFA
jgi:hypothetical protein